MKASANMLAPSQPAGTMASAFPPLARTPMNSEEAANPRGLPSYETTVIDNLSWNELCVMQRELTREGKMLRITIHSHPGAATFQLEGRLAGPWVHELAASWRTTLDESVGPVVRVDLTAVTFVDDAGKDLLTAMHRRGAKFVAADCLMNAVVAEVAGAPALVYSNGRQTAGRPR
jgi:hypothetical protein